MISSSLQALTFIDVWEYRVRGNSMLSNGDIQRIVSPYLGAARTVEEIDEAAAALQQAYRDAGYATVIVSIPGQDIIDGVVNLDVNEAKVRRVRVTGSEYFSLKEIKSEVPSLAEGNVPNIPRVQKEINALNSANSNLTVVPMISAGPTEKDIDIELSVSDKSPVHASMVVNNYHSEDTSPRRLGFELGHRNLWQKHHDFTMQYQMSPDETDEVKVIALSYLMPAGSDGEKIAIYGMDSNTETATVGDVSVLGNGSVVGFRYIKPMKKNGGGVHSISLGFDYKDFLEDIPIDEETVLSTPVDYVSWRGQYDVFSRKENIERSLSFGVTLGIRGVLNESDEFDNKRSEASPNFFLIDGEWEQRYEIFGEWQLVHNLRMQLADSPLLSNEQFSAGGVKSVNGYYEAQLQGDYGGILNIDLETPKFGQSIYAIDYLKAAIFYDAAKVWIKEPLEDQVSESIAASYGIGLRAKLMKYIDLKSDFGFVLKDQGSLEEGDMRFTAELVVEY